MRPPRSLVAALTAAVLFAASATAQKELDHLVPTFGASGGYAGTSVALDGARAVLGAPGLTASSAYPRSGGAYVFQLSGGVWKPDALLLPQVPKSYGYAGTSVAVRGTRIAIGALEYQSAGSVDLFQKGIGGWFKLAHLTAGDPQTQGSFGAAVVLDDERVYVGAPGADQHAGAVYVFARNVFGWWFQEAKLTASDASVWAEFGASLAVDGERLVVGAPRTDAVFHPECGAAYVFERSGSTRTQTQKLVATKPRSGDDFGRTVAVAGERVLVGLPGANSKAGAVDAFAPNSIFVALQLERRLTASDAEAYDFFGCALAFDGARAVIGSRKFDPGVSGFGKAYVFTPSSGHWPEQAQLTPTSAKAVDFGRAIALDDGRALIGDRLDSTAAPAAGGAYLFDVAVP